MDYIVHRVAKSQTRLSDFHSTVNQEHGLVQDCGKTDLEY